MYESRESKSQDLSPISKDTQFLRRNVHKMSPNSRTGVAAKKHQGYATTGMFWPGHEHYWLVQPASTDRSNHLFCT